MGSTDRVDRIRDPARFDVGFFKAIPTPMAPGSQKGQFRAWVESITFSNVAIEFIEPVVIFQQQPEFEPGLSKIILCRSGFAQGLFRQITAVSCSLGEPKFDTHRLIVWKTPRGFLGGMQPLFPVGYRAQRLAEIEKQLRQPRRGNAVDSALEGVNRTFPIAQFSERIAEVVPAFPILRGRLDRSAIGGSGLINRPSCW